MSNVNAYAGVGGTVGVGADLDGSGNKIMKGDSSLEMDDFLNLLAAQMANQDPMNPSTDTEFIAQMAQFSTLEAMKTLTDLTYAQHATSMIGKHVEVAYIDERGDMVIERGIVDNVKLLGGIATVSVKGEDYETSSIMQILTEEEFNADPDGDPLTRDEITTDDERLIDAQMYAASITGKYVKIEYIDDKKKEITDQGQVDSVTIVDGVVTISIDGREYDRTHIKEILTENEYVDPTDPVDPVDPVDPEVTPDPEV